jgi:hypothetical protein
MIKLFIVAFQCVDNRQACLPFAGEEDGALKCPVASRAEIGCQEYAPTSRLIHDL